MVVVAKAYPSVEFTLPLLADVAFDSKMYAVPTTFSANLLQTGR
jgi:hypothetical protein